MLDPPFDWYGRTYPFFYFIALSSAVVKVEIMQTLIDDPPPGVLFSYKYIAPTGRKMISSFKEKRALMDKIRDSGGYVMMDSGAFSAYQSGETINLDSYIAFIKDYSELFSVVVNLDVINDPKQSAVNLKRMEDAGINAYVPVMPVFHLSSSLSYLTRMSHYDWIGIGGIAGQRNRNFKLGKVSSLGMPNRFHLFGVSDLEDIAAFHPYSSDSTTWLRYSANGLIRSGRGRFSVGERERERLLSPAMEAELSKQAVEYGLTLKDLIDSNVARIIYNYKMTLDLVSAIRFKRVPKRQSLF